MQVDPYLSSYAFFGVLGLCSWLAHRYEKRKLADDSKDFMFSEYQGRRELGFGYQDR